MQNGKGVFYNMGRFCIPEIKDKLGGFDIILSPSYFHSGYLSFYSKHLMDLSPSAVLKMNRNDIERFKIQNKGKIISDKIDRSIVVKVVEDKGVMEGTAILMEHPEIIHLLKERVFKGAIEG